MSVEIASTSWGTITDRFGNSIANLPYTIKSLGDVELQRGVTNADGQIPGFIDGGKYKLTYAGITHYVDAIDGTPGTQLIGSTPLAIAGNVTTAVAAGVITPVNVVGGWAVVPVVDSARPTIRLDVYVNKISHSVALANANMLLYEDGVLRQGATVEDHAAGKGEVGRLVYYGSPGVGAHTYEIKLVSIVAGNIVLQTDPSAPALLTVEGK